MNLSYTNITAPIAGRVGRTSVTKGNVVGPNSGVLTQIVSIDPMYVLSPGQPARVPGRAKGRQRGQSRQPHSAAELLRRHGIPRTRQDQLRRYRRGPRHRHHPGPRHGGQPRARWSMASTSRSLSKATSHIQNTGGWDQYQSIACPLKNASGTKSLCLVFKGGKEELVRLDKFIICN